MDEYKSLDVRPYQLMCVVCRLGAQTDAAYCHANCLDTILNAAREDPCLPLTLHCDVTSLYRYQNCGAVWDTPEGTLFNRRRDLTILQKLALVPGDTRPALELFARIIEKIETTQGICGFNSVTAGSWRGCALAASGNYECGRERGLKHICPGRTDEDKAEHKKTSCRSIYTANGLRIRPHHLMCITCFHAGRDELAPIQEDNLFEVIEVIQKNPEMPVTLVEGCCMICPPCSQFMPESGLCVGRNAMALRDEKKDLDVLQLLGLNYGDTMAARKLLQLLYERVECTTQVCGYGDGTTSGYEWTVCGGADGNDGYRSGRQAGLGVAAAAPPDPSPLPPHTSSS